MTKMATKQRTYDIPYAKWAGLRRTDCAILTLKHAQIFRRQMEAQNLNNL